MSEDSRNIKLTQLLNGYNDDLKRQLQSCDHGSVVSYNIDTQTATIQPLAMERTAAIEKGPDNFEQQPYEALKPIPGVKVEWPSVSVEGLKIIVGHTFLPIGTEGKLTFTKHVDGNWNESGGIYEPESDNFHDVNGAFFTPVGQPRTKSFKGLEKDKTYLIKIEGGFGNAEIKVDINTGEMTIDTPSNVTVDSDGTVSLGRAASNDLIKFADLFTIFNNHTHTVTGTAGVPPAEIPVKGVAAPTGTPLTESAKVLNTKVR